MYSDSKKKLFKFMTTLILWLCTANIWKKNHSPMTYYLKCNIFWHLSKKHQSNFKTMDSSYFFMTIQEITNRSKIILKKNLPRFQWKIWPHILKVSNHGRKASNWQKFWNSNKVVNKTNLIKYDVVRSVKF